MASDQIVQLQWKLWNISTNTENEEYTVGLFIDLKKAFDSIDHTLLLKKLDRYGIREVANSWIKNYLDDRYQYVQINYGLK